MELGTDLTGPIAPAQQAVIEALLARRELAPRQRERLEMVKAAWLGGDVATIARWSGRTSRPVRRWLTTFRDGGVTALAVAPIPGRPPKADGAYLAALETALATPPRRLGLPFDVWTSRRLSASLLEQTGVRIAPGWLRVLLHQQRFACGRPELTRAIVRVDVLLATHRELGSEAREVAAVAGGGGQCLLALARLAVVPDDGPVPRLGVEWPGQDGRRRRGLGPLVACRGRRIRALSRAVPTGSRPPPDPAAAACWTDSASGSAVSVSRCETACVAVWAHAPSSQNPLSRALWHRPQWEGCADRS